ncbi:hypothetical protein [Roseicella aerolata]|uniref:Uncharacterized protein n=1 Tax=Roseicella aerolata TaxID=2883479 RepID=A0A9X1L997_9PROT|nr:hypothetical protein [Roseicella aerolata]MCB4820132.1 hypothetical protein [Roseicella aerolata]
MTVTVAAVTGPGSPAPPFLPVEGARAPQPLLGAALAALPAARGCVALLLPPAPRLGAGPARWRMAEAILRDAAAIGGGALLRSAAGGTLLLGASPAAAARAAAALGSLAGVAQPLPLWRLPEEAEAVLAWAAAQAPAPAPQPAPALPVTGLHQALDGLAAEAVLQADALVAPSGALRGRRLRLLRPAVAAALGPLAQDPDLLAHAEDRLAARLLPGLAAWARDLPGLRLIPLPGDRLPAPALRPGATGVLPLAALAAPDFPDRRQELAGRGWGVALDGLDAASLGLLDLQRLPADLLLLRWSPGLAAPGPAAALRALDPARLILAGGRDAAARDFAAASGMLLARPA